MTTGHGTFTEANAGDVVIAWNALARDGWLSFAMTVITCKLHEAVTATEPR